MHYIYRGTRGAGESQRIGGEHDFATLWEIARMQLVVCSGTQLANITKN